MLAISIQHAEQEMVWQQEQRKPFSIEDAVDVSRRVLGLQLDLCAGSRTALESDRFAIGYMWGFCGGALTALNVADADLYKAFGIVCRQILAERDAIRILAGIPSVAGNAVFQDGEAAGLADARACVERDRPPIGLVLHLSRG
jgi:hypothetical protein